MVDVSLRDLKDYHFWLDAQRRGRLKASIRLALEALVGLGVRLFVREAPDQPRQSVELLVIHPSERSRELGRKSALLSKIQSSGLQYAEVVFRKSNYRHAGVFCHPDRSTPLRFYGLAGHANYLIGRYQPRVVVTERYNEVFNYYLRHYLPDDGRIVHLAHAIPSHDSRKFCMNNFDYYFLYGQSSIDKMLNKPVRFGSSKACAVGSYLIGEEYCLEPVDPNGHVLILAMGDWPKYAAQVEQAYRVLLNWAVSRSDLVFWVKLHPNRGSDFWLLPANRAVNVNVLPRACGMKDAVASASVVVNMHSNACIDAALLNRPVIPADPLPFPDEFEVESYFTANCHDAKSLDCAYNEIIGSYPHYLQQARRFAERHVANGARSIPCIVSTLQAIVDGREDFPCVMLPHLPPSCSPAGKG